MRSTGDFYLAHQNSENEFDNPGLNHITRHLYFNKLPQILLNRFKKIASKCFFPL